MSQATMDRQMVDGLWTIVLRGVDPATRFWATWHITPAAPDAHGEPQCRVERVDGDITHPAVWMQATKTITTVPEADAFALVHVIAGDHAAA